MSVIEIADMDIFAWMFFYLCRFI